MKAAEAREINVVFGVVLGALLLIEVLFGAVDLAPEVGYTVPASLVWIETIPLADSLWFDSLFSLLFLAWIIFSYVERKPLSGRSMRSNRGGGVATGVILLLLALFLIGAFLYAFFGMNLETLWMSFKGFLGGL
jgi:hypothetical protein